MILLRALPEDYASGVFSIIGMFLTLVMFAIYFYVKSKEEEE